MPNKWFAAVLGLLFHPLAFIYLGKFKWAGLYFLLSALLVLANFSVLADAIYLSLRIALLLFVVCMRLNSLKLAQLTLRLHGIVDGGVRC